MTDARDDSGVSLIELIVVIVLIGILGTAVAAIFINSWRAQEQVTSTTQATNAGQVIGQVIERAVRNGRCIDLVNSNMVRVNTVYPAGDSRRYQQIWIAPSVDTPGESDLYLAASSTTSLPSPGPWIENVSHVAGSSAYFALSPDKKTLTYAIDMETEATPVTISGSVSLRDTSGGPSTCWS